MGKVLELIGGVMNKYGLFPAATILALVLGGYGCYQAKQNEVAIRGLQLENVELKAQQNANMEKVMDRLGGVEKNLIELTTQIKLLVDGKLVIGK